MVKTHAEMKRRLQAKEKFIMLSSIHEGFEGQIRTPHVIQTNAIYSIIENEPDSKVSQMNGGKGCFMQFGKASNWHIEDGVCEFIGSLEEPIFSFKFLKDFEEEVEESVLDEMSQMTFDELVKFVEEKPFEHKPKGRHVTVEYVGTRLPYKEYAISCEQHDAYIYLGKDVEEAIKAYEEDRNCVVSDWDMYEGV